MKKVNMANNVRLLGKKNFKGKDKMIDYFLIYPGKEMVYAFSKRYSHGTYDMCKSGISVNTLRRMKSRDYAVMRLVQYTNYILPYLNDYYEFTVA